MNVRNLTFLLSSAASFSIVSGAQAAPEVVVKPGTAGYVRVCDAYGKGYFYIPGTETCMRLSGNVKADLKGGSNVWASTDKDLDDSGKTYGAGAGLTLVFQTASETELGTLRSYSSFSSGWNKGRNLPSARLGAAYIELGGFRVGLDDTIFNHWTGGYGKVMNSDIISASGDTRTNVVSYSFDADSGFSAIIGVELGNDSGPNLKNDSKDKDTIPYYSTAENKATQVNEKDAKTNFFSKKVKGYVPHALFGVKFVQKWGGVSAVAAYDSHYEKWSGKARVDFNVHDRLNLWAMGGYKNNVDYYKKEGNDSLSLQNTTVYANWGGEWAGWTGATYKINPQANFNAEVSYSAAKTFATSINIAYTLVPGLVITPEVTYVAWNDTRLFEDSSNAGKQYKVALEGRNALQAMIRLQHSF